MKEVLKNKTRRYVLLRPHNENKLNLCFGKETWVMRKKRDEKKMEAAHMRFLGLRLAVSLKDRKANAKISVN